MNTPKNPRGNLLTISTDDLQDIICRELFVTKEEVTNISRTREKEVVDARKIAIYIGYTNKHNSYKELQKVYGLTSNQSIQNALESTRNLIETNPRFRRKYDRITERIMYELM